MHQTPRPPAFDSPTDFSPGAPGARAALVTAHPGHELCVLGWLRRARPCVFVLTDGSGHGAPPRLGETTGLLESAGARRGTVYGRHTDAQIYGALLGGDVDFFAGLAAELAAAFASEHFDYVVCEAAEGYNPTHDLCHVLTAAAVARANRAHGCRTAHYEFPLIRRGRDDDGAPGRGDSPRLRLDDEALGEKLAAMRAHPHLRDEVSAGLDGVGLRTLQDYPELAAEVRGLTEGMGPEAFRVERLRGVSGLGADAPAMPPFYERYGELLVRRGRYAHAVRYAEHVLPVAERLRRFPEEG